MTTDYTLGATLAAAEARVHEAAPDEAALKCQWLFSRLLCCSRLELPVRRAQRLTELQLRQIAAGIARLAAGEPLQYVLGEAEFMGRTFACDSRALIPRPETEQLLAWLLADEALRQIPAPVIAEVGTGSGCIVITLALERPDGQYLATDISHAALELARENASRHGAVPRIRFVEGNLLAGITPETTFQHSAECENVQTAVFLTSTNLKSDAIPKTTFQHSAECWNVATAISTTFANLDAVVSNPPYVRAACWAQLDKTVRDFEPREALLGGADGLSVIRPLLAEAFQALKPGGILFLEIGEDQGDAVRAIARLSGFRDIQLRSDLSGKDRLLRAVK